MQVSIAREGDTAAAKPAEFTLPANVVVGKDGKTLEDNRPFYQTRFTFNSTLASLQDQFNASEKAKADAKPKDEGYSLMTPFNFVGGIISSVFGFLGTMVSSILGICGYGGEGKTEGAAEEAAKTDNKDKAEKA